MEKHPEICIKSGVLYHIGIDAFNTSGVIMQITKLGEVIISPHFWDW